MARYGAYAGRLAACVNILPSMTSLYRWEGKVTQSEGAALLAETTADLAEKLMEEVEAKHPYAAACAMILPVESCLPAYAQWLRSELDK